jgi:Domain of unknown function (DUF4192)
MDTAARTTAPGSGIRLRDPGELVAATPSLLGFHPERSLVVVTVRGTTIGLTLRVDLAPPPLHAAMIGHLLTPIRQYGAHAALVVVVSDSTVSDSAGEPPPEPPERELVRRLCTAFADAGVPVAHAVWTPSTQGGARWRCYHDEDCAGTVPARETTALAAAMASAGSVTFDSRDDLARVLEPPDPVAVRRRSVLLDETIRLDDTTSAQYFELVRRRVAERDVPTDDDRLVRLALALSDYRVRDLCLDYALGGEAAAAEDLWLALTRQLPAPERAEPATLLAVSAYLRGDGTMANVALEAADKALPGHNLAALLRGAIGLGLPPQRLRQVLSDAVADARLDLRQEGD